jgi:hypothetical protein
LLAAESSGQGLLLQADSNSNAAVASAAAGAQALSIWTVLIDRIPARAILLGRTTAHLGPLGLAMQRALRHAIAT